MGVVKGLLALALVLNVVVVSNGGKSSNFVRKTNKNRDMPLDSDVFRVPPGYNAPQQVHITQGDLVGRAMIISWVTMDEPGSSAVRYWSEKNGRKRIAKGKMSTYRFFNYSSGFIHHTTIRKLKYNTKYYYEVGLRNTTRRFSFITPPQIGLDVPYTFGLIGDLGQSFDSNTTLSHYELSPKKEKQYCLLETSLMLIGTRIMIMLGGILGEGLQKGVLHISHGYGLQGTMKLSLLQKLMKPNLSSLLATVTMFLTKHLRALHPSGILSRELQHTSLSCPRIQHMAEERHNIHGLKRSYGKLKGEAMRTNVEAWFVKYKVDVVFAGHVHAYERSERVSNIAYKITNGLCTPVKDQSAPVYITIGDAGNYGVIDSNMIQPQPEYSAFREASFGHGMFDIKNRTHAHYSWNRNQDGVAVEADSVWFFNRHWYPVDDST
ncbi:hypothetical protein ACSQ67_021955 [Phaseolus vulgaris]